jgi:iron-sulfur cluster assembly accessory protein
MQMDRRKSPLDRVVAEIDDFQVVVDAASWIYLENSQLDYEETLMESGFRFHNPQVKTTCGCGSSFGV